MQRAYSVLGILVVVSMLLTTVPAQQAQADEPVKGYWKYVEDLTNYNETSPVPRRVAAYDVWMRFENEGSTSLIKDILVDTQQHADEFIHLIDQVLIVDNALAYDIAGEIPCDEIHQVALQWTCDQARNYLTKVENMVETYFADNYLQGYQDFSGKMSAVSKGVSNVTSYVQTGLLVNELLKHPETAQELIGQVSLAFSAIDSGLKKWGGGIGQVLSGFVFGPAMKALDSVAALEAQLGDLYAAYNYCALTSHKAQYDPDCLKAWPPINTHDKVFGGGWGNCFWWPTEDGEVGKRFECSGNSIVQKRCIQDPVEPYYGFEDEWHYDPDFEEDFPRDCGEKECQAAVIYGPNDNSNFDDEIVGACCCPSAEEDTENPGLTPGPDCECYYNQGPCVEEVNENNVTLMSWGDAIQECDYPASYWTEFQKEWDETGGCVGCGMPGGTHPDDTYDVSVPAPVVSGTYSASGEARVVVLNRGFVSGVENLLNSLDIPHDLAGVSYASHQYLWHYPVLIIPTGGLYGLDSLTEFKDNLRRYVEWGGTVIAFSQARGFEYNALPGGEVSGFGYLEDENCQYKSVGISEYHPVLSGQDSLVLDLNVDGFFTHWPENTQLLLERTVNGMPAMIMYEYGEGNVIATTSFADWGSANMFWSRGDPSLNWSQRWDMGTITEDDWTLVRDVCAWALDTQDEMPEFGPDGEISLPIHIANKNQGTDYPSFSAGGMVAFSTVLKNYEDIACDRVVFNVYNPNWELDGSVEMPVSIMPEEYAVVDWDYSTSPSSKTGRYTVVASLYNDDEWLDSLSREGFLLGVTGDDLTGYTVDFTLKNPYGEIVHEETQEIEIQSYETGTVTFSYSEPSELGMWELGIKVLDYKSDVVHQGSQNFAVSEYAANPDGWVYQGSDLVFGLTSDKETYWRGEEATFTVHAWNRGETDEQIYCRLRKGHFGSGYAGTDIRTFVVPAGEYYSYTVNGTIPSRSFERWIANFYMGDDTSGPNVGYCRRFFKINSKPVITMDVSTEKQEYVSPNSISGTVTFEQKYTATISNAPYIDELHIKIMDPYRVCVSEASYDMQNEQIIGIILPFTAPAMPRVYSVRAEAYDEEGNSITSGATYFRILPKNINASLSLSKEKYVNGEEISILVDLENNEDAAYDITGTVVVSNSEDDTVFQEGYDVSLNAGESTQEVINFTPSGDTVYGIYTVDAEATIEGIQTQSLWADFELKKGYTINADFDNGNKTYAVREPISINLEAINISPISQDVAVEVSCSSLGLNETRVFSLDPGESDYATYTSVVPTEIVPGVYDLTLTTLDDNLTRSHSFSVPKSDLSLSIENHSYSIGEIITIDLSNTGGVDTTGNYTIELIDSYGMVLYSAGSNQEVLAGEIQDLEFIIPEQATNGNYNLVVNCTDTRTNNLVELNENVAINGLAASLVSVTDKKGYFVHEDITITSDITNSEIPIQSGTLNLQILSAGHRFVSDLQGFIGNAELLLDGYGMLAIPVGDLDGDGADDFVVSVSDETGGPAMASTMVVAEGWTEQYRLIAVSGDLDEVLWQYYVDGLAWAAPAGDLDGDGLDDVVITGLVDYLGNEAVQYDIIGLKGNNGQELWQISGAVQEGAGPNYPFEWVSSRSAGDLNGDGNDDLLVSAITGADSEWDHECEVSAIDGENGEILWQESGAATSAIAAIGIGQQLVNNTEMDYDQLKLWLLGTMDWSPAIPAGDLNNDGNDDVLISFVEVEEEELQAYWLMAVDGSAGEHIWEIPEQFPGEPLLLAEPDPSEDMVGKVAKASPMGDVDGDGLGDVLIVTQREEFEDMATDIGVFCGYETETLWKQTSPGQAVAVPAGDMNGDGIDDVLVNYTVPNYEEERYDQYVMGLNGYNGETLWNDDPQGWGQSAGDFNGDGSTDVLITGVEESEYYFVAVSGYDGKALWRDSVSVEGALALPIIGDYSLMLGIYITAPRFYYSQALSAGDLDGNGESDMLLLSEHRVSARNGANGQQLWWAGTNAGTDAGPDSEGGAIVVGMAPDKAGELPDFNEDGIDDLLLTASKIVYHQGAWGECQYNGVVSAVTDLSAGIGWVRIWEEDTPVEYIADSGTVSFVNTVSIPDDLPFETVGDLSLLGTVYSNTGQIIDRSDRWLFTISDSDTLIELATDKDSYLSGEPVIVSGTVINGSDISNDFYVRILQDGDQIWGEYCHDLEGGGSLSFALTTGADNSFVLEATVSSGYWNYPYTTTTRFIEVNEPVPSIDISIDAPDAVGFEDLFDVTVTIENTGQCEVELSADIAGQTYDDIFLSEGGTTSLETSLSITEDSTIDVTVSGDVYKRISQEIVMGENAAIEMAGEGPYIQGTVEIPMEIANTGVLDTEFSASFLIGESEVMKTFTVTAGEIIDDTVSFNLAKGEYTLEYSSPFEEGTYSFAVIGPDATIEVTEQAFYFEGAVEIPMRVKNIGVGDAEFEAVFSIADQEIAKVFSVPEGQTETDTLPFVLEEGEHLLEYSSPFEQGAIGIYVGAPHFEISELPANRDLAIGHSGTWTFTVTNTGGAEGVAYLDLMLPDWEISDFAWVMPGEEEEISLRIIIPDDLESGEIKAQYELNGSRGEFPFFIEGAKISVEAFLNGQTAFEEPDCFGEEGDLASLTLEITNDSGFELQLYGRAQLNDFEEVTETFTLLPGETEQLSFDVPVAFTGNKLFYGVYLDSGRSLHLNALYVYPCGDPPYVWMDKQVYNTDESATIFIYTLDEGIITLNAPGYEESFEIQGTLEPIERAFTIPKLSSGTYYLEYTFDYGETCYYPFDVIGYSAVINQFTLNKERYISGETIRANATIEVNRDFEGYMKVRVYSYGTREVIDGFDVPYSFAEGENPMAINRVIDTEEKGIHALYYTVYANVDEEPISLASGAEYFDAAPFPNSPPMADAGGPYIVDEGSLVDFSAYGSIDPDGDYMEYRWDFESDGEWDTDWSILGIEMQTWLDDYTGAVTVEVRDAESSQIGTANITVNNIAPDVSIWCDEIANAGTAVSLAGVFYDPGSDTHMAIIDWGDGTIVPVAAEVEEGWGVVSGTHIYTQSGTHAAILTVTDDDGGFGTASATIHVVGVGPMVGFNWEPESQTEGSSAQFTDTSDGNIATWSWDFGGAGSSSTQNPEIAFMDNGEYEVCLTVTEVGGLSDTICHTIMITDAAPIASFEWSPDLPDEGSAAQFTDSSTSPADEIVSWSWDFGGLGTSTEQNSSFTFVDDGAYEVRLTVTDEDGSTDTICQTITVSDLSPTAGFTWSPEPQDEGSAIDFTDTSTSLPDELVAWAWDFAGIETSSDQNPSFIFSDDGTSSVCLTVIDDDGSTDTICQSPRVLNVAPRVGTITVSADLTEVETAISASADFNDVGVLDTHAATWNWGDDTTSAGVITEADGSGSVAGDHTYSAPGIYTITLTVEDDDGGIDISQYRYVIVFNPNGEFVIGSGRINSPASAFVADPSIEGKASFGFVCKYIKHKDTPVGMAMFSFHPGNLWMLSSNYEWLIVDDNVAICKGTGMMKGKRWFEHEPVKFVISAVDEGHGWEVTDKFRIQIWDSATGELIYDNQIGDDIYANPTDEVERGEIMIHQRGKGGKLW